MKKLALLTTVLIALLFMGGIAQATPITASGKYMSADRGKEFVWVFTSTTSVVTGTPAEFELVMPAVYGKISEIYFESSSPNCHVWLSGISGAAASAASTYIVMPSINLGFSPELVRPRTYLNLDTVQAKVLYLNIDNQSATATGNWKLVITFPAE